MTLAAESFTIYEKWIRLLLHRKKSKSPGSKATPTKPSVLESFHGDDDFLDENDSILSTDFKPLKSDLITDYFFQPQYSQDAAVSCRL